MRSRHLRPPLTDRSALTIREYRPGDEERILATFNRVFAAVDPGFVPRDLATWRWLYQRNPSGSRIWLALDEEGAVVSQYAGLGQRMWVQGERANFSQSVDSMTDLGPRAGLKRPGAFVLTGRPYAEHFGGDAPDRDLVMWGLPVPAAWRIGRRYLDYELIRTQLALFAAPDDVRPGIPRAGAADVRVEEVARFPDELDALSERLGRERGAVAVRDRAQLAWRFEDDPRHTYRLAVARTSRGLAGLAACRPGTFDGRDGLLVADFAVGQGEDAAAAALLDWLAAAAADADRAELVAVFPETAPEWLDFQRAGFRARGTQYVLVGRSYARRIEFPWLRRSWYYTLGDTDLA